MYSYLRNRGKYVKEFGVLVPRKMERSVCVCSLYKFIAWYLASRVIFCTLVDRVPEVDLIYVFDLFARHHSPAVT